MSTAEASQQQLSDGQNKGVSISGEILAAAVIFFFVVIVFTFFLYMYTRVRRGGVSDAYRSPARLVFGPDLEPAVVRSGSLDPAVVRSLPISVYRAADLKDGIKCAVCLSELVDGEKARLLPKCGHGFHLDCIDMWFHSHSTCPLCRSPVGPQAAVKAEDGGAPPVISTDGFSTESPRLPTNVLFWGNHDQVSTGGGGGSPAVGGLQEAPPSSSPSSSSSSPGNSKSMLVVDIPRRASENLPLSSLPSGWYATEEKSPTAVATTTPPLTRLRSFRRLLSREKKAVGSPCGGDIEQGRAGNGGGE